MFLHVVIGAFIFSSSMSAHAQENHCELSSPSAYVSELANPRCKNGLEVHHLVGRILRGKTDEDFKFLSPRVERKVIMLVGASGLVNFIGHTPRAMLISVGYPENEIEQLIKEKTVFKLFVSNENDKTESATWDHLVSILKKAYPGTPIAEKVAASLPNLKKHSGPEGYQWIQKNAPKGFWEQAMTLAKYQASQGSIYETRKFLHDILNLNPLFMGDGFSYTERNGKLIRESEEYFSLNDEIKNYKNAIVTPL